MNVAVQYCSFLFSFSVCQLSVSLFVCLIPLIFISFISLFSHSLIASLIRTVCPCYNTIIYFLVIYQSTLGPIRRGKENTREEEMEKEERKRLGKTQIISLFLFEVNWPNFVNLELYLN